METCATCKWWRKSPDPALPFEPNYRICGKIEDDDSEHEINPDTSAPLLAFIAYEAGKDTFPSPPSQQLFTLGEFGCNQHEPREDAD
jgi:hypothetical protein